ncbi:MAG: aminopeptidase P family protein [Bdellovibrionaceae bacterium]|nr:aminopeptidase P family protein [Pseudobdellovibrionaceae bacterium]
MIFSEKTISQRRQRLEPEWKNLLSADDCVLVFCGEPHTRPGGLDQTYPFIPHPSYYWLSGYRRVHGVVFYSKEHGWKDFILPVTKDESIWEGMLPFAFNGLDVKTLNDFLSQHKFKNVIALGQIPVRTDYAVSTDTPLAKQLKEKFDQCRRIKDADEVKRVSQLADIANMGYKKIRSFIRPGVTEREIQIEYEAEIQRHGAQKLPYDTIVGSGPNAAVLHAIPTLKKVKEGELVLIDAGADIEDYCVDITRVLPVSGKFSNQQQSLYDLVFAAQKHAINMCRVGQEWSQVHLTTARIIAEGLVSLGIMKGSVDGLLETAAISVFYPHGVGHLVGLRVRDTGQEENISPRSYAGTRIRVDLPLKENMLITVEPGCYFIPTLINDSTNREKFKDMINFSEAEKWLNIGGVRIEDDILITQSEPSNLTAVVAK